MMIGGTQPGMSFEIRGSDDHDSLVVESRVGNAQVVLRLPIRALPWRDIRVIERHGHRPHYGCGEGHDPMGAVKLTLEKPDQIEERTGITGATRLDLADGIATIAIDPKSRLLVPCLHVATGAVTPAVVQVVGAGATRAKGDIRVAQLAGGQRVGGVTLELGGRGQPKKS